MKTTELITSKNNYDNNNDNNIKFYVSFQDFHFKHDKGKLFD